jgi:hypothetical protein
VSRARHHTVHALFARVALAVAVLFVRIVHALLSCCRASFARVVRANSHASSHVVCVHRVCHLLMLLTLPRIVRTLSHAVSRASSRVVHECHACYSHALSCADHTRCHAPFACVARLATLCSRVSRVSIAWVMRRLRVIINSLPLINTHVSDVNLSSHIC